MTASSGPFPDSSILESHCHLPNPASSHRLSSPQLDPISCRSLAQNKGRGFLPYRPLWRDISCRGLAVVTWESAFHTSQCNGCGHCSWGGGGVSRDRRRAGQEGWPGKGKVVKEGCRQVGERNSIPREPKQINTGNGRKKTKTKWTNRKRTGNLLIKANHTSDSVLVQIYITPHTDPGTLVTTSGPSDTVRRCWRVGVGLTFSSLVRSALAL